MDAADQRIFLAEEIGLEVANAYRAAARLVDRAHVAAGAERLAAGPAHDQRADRRVPSPGDQLRIESPIHGERQGVEPESALPLEQDFRIRIHARQRFR